MRCCTPNAHFVPNAEGALWCVSTNWNLSLKITGIETFIVDAGWRPWIFVKVETDDGVTGYGECSEGRNPWAVAGAIRDFTPLLLGQDARPYEMRFWDMLRGSRQSPGGIAAKAIAGIELALIDIKADRKSVV